MRTLPWRSINYANRRWGWGSLKSRLGIWDSLCKGPEVRGNTEHCVNMMRAEGKLGEKPRLALNVTLKTLVFKNNTKITDL